MRTVADSRQEVRATYMSGLRATVIVGVSICFAASASLVVFGVYFLTTGNWLLAIAMIAGAIVSVVGSIGVLRGFRPMIGKPHDRSAEP
jgi:hypothetical protein